MEVKWNILKLHQKSQNLSKIYQNHQLKPEDTGNLVIHSKKDRSQGTLDHCDGHCDALVYVTSHAITKVTSMLVTDDKDKMCW